MNYFSHHFHNEYYSDRNAPSAEAKDPADVEDGIIAVNIPLLCEEPNQDCQNEDEDQTGSDAREEPPFSTIPPPEAVFNSAKSDSFPSTTNKSDDDGELDCSSDLPGAGVVAGSHDNEVEERKNGPGHDYPMATEVTIDANTYFSRHSRNGNSCFEGHSSWTGERLNSGEDLSRESVPLVSGESTRDHQIDEMDRYDYEIIDGPHVSAKHLPSSEIEYTNNIPLHMQKESNDVREESPTECSSGIQRLLLSRELQNIPESSAEAMGKSYNAISCAYQPIVMKNAKNVAPYRRRQIDDNFNSDDGAGNQLNIGDDFVRKNIPLVSTEWIADHQIDNIHLPGVDGSSHSPVMALPLIDSNFAHDEMIVQNHSEEGCPREDSDMVQIDEDFQTLNETTIQAEAVANCGSFFNHSVKTEIKANAVSYFRRHFNNDFYSDGFSSCGMDAQLNTVDDIVNETMAHGESIGYHHHETADGSDCSAIVPDRTPAEVTSANIDSVSRNAPPNHSGQHLPMECTEELQGLSCLPDNGFRDLRYTFVWSEAARNTDPYTFTNEQALATTRTEITANKRYQLHNFFNKFYSSRKSRYLTSGEGRSMNLGDEIIRENIRMASGDWIRYIPNESDPQSDSDNNSNKAAFSPSSPAELTSSNDTAAISLLLLAQNEEHQQLLLQGTNNDNADEVRVFQVEFDVKHLPSTIAPSTSETTAAQADAENDEGNYKHVPSVDERCSLLPVTKPKTQVHHQPKPKQNTELSGPEIEKPRAPPFASKTLHAHESFTDNFPTLPSGSKPKSDLQNEKNLLKIESKLENTTLAIDPESHNGKKEPFTVPTSQNDYQKPSAKPKKTKRRPKRVIDESRICEPTENDILFGRGGFTNTHPGNIKFREEALKLRDWYESATKEEKYTISDLLVETIRGDGHRFLEKGSDGLWHEVIGNGARKKASQALRERQKKKNEKPLEDSLIGSEA